MDAWLVLAVQDVQQVYQWRLQAERQMRGEGKPGLTDEQVRLLNNLLHCVFQCIVAVHMYRIWDAFDGNVVSNDLLYVIWQLYFGHLFHVDGKHTKQCSFRVHIYFVD